MSTSVRERQARLLADPRSTEPRARLAQAVSRAEFLLRLSRTVSAIQNPQRALEALIALLLEDMVDVAQVVVRTGPWQHVCGSTQGREPACATGRWADGSPAAFDNLIGAGIGDDIMLPGSGPGRRATLTELFHKDLADVVDALGSEQLTVLPLTARGRCFGALVLGRAPGYGFTGSQSFLEDLAERVAVGLDASLVVAESRYIATVLRDSLAPPKLAELPGLGVSTFYRVAHQSEDVGGDFLDIHGTPDDLTLVCGDVAGKGVEAAVHAKEIRNSVRTAAHVERTPAWILGLINRVLVTEADEFSEGLATAVCARLRPREGVLRIDLANAGHPPALLVRADGTVMEVNAGGVALGLIAESDYAETVVDLQPFDTLVLYTDGVTEARGLDGLYGDQRLQELLRGLGGLSASAVVQSVAVAIAEHLGDRAHDDIAIVAVQFRPEPG